ncbi:hypothetical protein TrST_g1151 [Triparma strigata]|uniref:AAA+ ATPase domain-containing protein n=1 Tax=Triparma strigata TaxID=1606541 RepID=A0A9W7E132_9STRA|nr:hypothetical protein TrST_g1151 [Triparma strigata]
MSQLRFDPKVRYSQPESDDGAAPQPTKPTEAPTNAGNTSPLRSRGMLSLPGDDSGMHLYSFGSQDLDHYNLPRRSKPKQTSSKLKDIRSSTKKQASSSAAPDPKKLKKSKSATSTQPSAGHGGGALDAGAPSGLSFLSYAYEEESSAPPQQSPDTDETLTPADPAATANLALPVDPLTPTLETGEDAINFFAQHGSSSPIKFVHLVKAESGVNFRPYDLQVVRPKDVGTHYYTMSSAGLVHVAPNTASEFIPLAEWMRQSTNFNMLRSIRFYKYYLHTKAFNMWRDNVRYKLYCNQRAKIQGNLFLAKDSFCEPLLELKKHMLDLQSVSLLDLGMKTFESNLFLGHQSVKRNDASKQFEEVCDKIQKIVQRVTENVANLASSVDKDDGNDGAANLFAAVEKNKSMVALKAEMADRRRILKRAEQEAGMLADFIRSVDYLIVECLAEKAIDTTDWFLGSLNQKRKNGLFETTVQFTSTSTGFYPPCPDIQKMISSVIDALVGTVNGVQRIVYTRPFTEHVLGVVKDAPNVQQIVRNSRSFKQICDAINVKISGDFDLAESYVHQHITTQFRDIYDDTKNWNFEKFKRADSKFSKFKSEMERVKDYEEKLDKTMKNRQQCGILEVESRNLKQIMTPMVRKKMSDMKELVRDLAKAMANRQLVEIKKRIQIVAARPHSLKDFAGYVESISNLKTKEKALTKHVETVEKMYNLLKQHHVMIPPEDEVQLDDLHNVLDEYKLKMEEAMKFKEELLPEMSTSLGLSINRLNQNLDAETAKLSEGVFIDVSNFDEPSPALDELIQTKQKLDSIEEKAVQFRKFQELFNLMPEEYENLKIAKDKFDATDKLWQTVNRWNEQYDAWMNDEFTTLDVEEINKDVQVFFKESFSMHKKLNNEVTAKLKDKTNDFKLKMNVILELGNPNMKNRHWEKIYTALQQTFYDNLTFALEELLSYGILNHQDLVSEVSAAASGEAQLEGSLSTIQAGWADMDFTCLNHRDQANIYILGSLEDIFTLLEDNQVTLQTMMGSRFIMGVRDEVETWAKKLGLLSETLDEWIACQRNWMYLETIFCAEDIQKQLPVESQKFMVVDKMWKNIMKQTSEAPKVIGSIDDGPSLLEKFQQANATLESVQKSLEDYLETKRMAFPRFYFLSNDELLEILSQTRDPHAVQPHMQKCFDGIKSIEFGTGRDAKKIIGFTDPKGENVKMTDECEAEGPVEFWLMQVQYCMRKALYDNGAKSWEEYPKDEAGQIDRGEWLMAYPAQTVIMIDQVYWTAGLGGAISNVESGADPEAVEKFYKFSLAQIDGMVKLVQTDLTSQQRIMIGAVITIDVNKRDVTRTHVTEKVSSIDNFTWTKQLRYYWEDKSAHKSCPTFSKEFDCVARQTNTCFPYGYEYLGNGPRLVITPLTDICYMTLTGAMHMKLGGAPAGPAGTGKTETTKDLGKALAVYCVVFNCSDGLDFKIMGRFFSGLAQQGAWACFDEFNRIDIEVLSVIAQQVLCIQQALFGNLIEFEFEGNVIPIKPSFGVFITMNPGYAGRAELPDNLKALFRPVAMMVPDYRLIAEIMLFAEGFVNALPLSNKMQQLYALASEQLSKQDHYDFGMRAVKSVLVAAGQLKRKEPETVEDLLLIRAMRDSNVPKFLVNDLPLFAGILSDLFPGIEVPYVDYGVLKTAIEDTLVSLELQKKESFISKVIQVHETQLVRHGMMVVGEAGSGKSTNMQVLAGALTLLCANGVVDRDGFYKTVDRLILNPKSITAGELYGEFNEMTNEWKDGIVPKLVRNVCQAQVDGSDNRKWIVFDGPVDAIWIENMNTVLDDNKTLCLANSERIKLPGTLHMMFEVMDLKVASPATVSRCGMVYMEQEHVGMLSLVRTWGTSKLSHILSEEMTAAVLKMVEDHVEDGIKFVREFCQEKVVSDNSNLVASLLKMLYCVLDPTRGFHPDHPKAMTNLKLFFVWSFVWSIGANITDASRPEFQGWVMKRFISLLPENCLEFLQNIYDYVMDEEKSMFVPWSDLMTDFTYAVGTPYFNIIVPTVETTRYNFVMKKLMCGGHNVLFSAETGVGKSVVIQQFLDEMSVTNEYVSYTMGYSAQTKPSNIRDVIEEKLEKKRKTLLGPPAGKKMLFFIDDLNMPALETYGAQPPNELLRQLIDQKGFYDVNKLFFKNVADVIFAGACAPPGGGRNEISPRLMRQFYMVWLPSLSEASMTRIFSNILEGFLSKTIPALSAFAGSIVKASVEIYSRVEKDLLPTPAKSHYTFNLRDMSKVFQGMLMILPQHAADEEQLLKLWCHEEARVVRDRLIDDHDRDWFNNMMKEMLATHMGKEWDTSEFASNLFGDYLTRDDKQYQQITDMPKLHELLVEYLEEYNITFPSQMHLVFFQDAINHVSRICRILRQPRGNALLVGVGGSGRQSLSRLAAFMADFKCKSIEITRGYGSNEFHEDLKLILMSAGAENQQTVFLFSDTQIVKESFLEDINNILNSGEVPNLYASDEMEKIIGMVRPLAKAAGKLETRDVILQHYIQLVRENLHIVLCMSPIGAAFRTRCRMFPSLVNCCTIDWFSAWPEDALNSVAMRFIGEGAKELGVEDFVTPLCEMAVKIHRSVEVGTVKFYNELKRHNYTTPTSYLELIKLYTETLRVKREEVSENEKRYRVGLEKLAETEVMVAELQETLKDMQPKIDAAKVETAELLVKVTKDQADADAQQSIVEKEVADANVVASEVQGQKDSVEADLAEALPALASAVKALDSLDKKSIAVCILMDQKPTWDDSKKMMNDSLFLQKLVDYDKDNIAPKIIKKLKKFMDNPEFTPDAVGRVSSAAKCFCMWVRAMYLYDTVAKTVEPKKIALAAAEKKLDGVMSELNEKRAVLRGVLEKVAELKALLQSTEAKKQALEDQAAKTITQLTRAEQLLGGLSGEKGRWIESADRLSKDRVNLVGNIILCAGMLAYLGPFTSEYRKEMGEEWVAACKAKNIPVDESFSLETIMGSPVTIRDWQIFGLPADQFSTENGMLTTMGRRWPLMIDPQGQANRWIRKMCANDNLLVIKLTEKDFLRTLENAIRYGNPILLENVQEELDPSLEPVLMKQIFKRGGQMMIHLGDSDIPYDFNFKFYITTKLANPHYMPEVCIKTTIINFTVTMSGLEDQLLVDVINNERPELEERNAQLVVSIAGDQKTLKEIEDKILYMLANASGNILDDEDLINALDDSKKTSSAIKIRLADAEVTRTEIAETREGYRSVATRGSVIYFVIAKLALVDPMYQYSLQFYKALFCQRLEKSQKSDSLDERLAIMIDDVTTNMYLNICRGLFEQDKMLYSFSIASSIKMHAGELSGVEWKTFMVGPGVADAATMDGNSLDKVGEDKSWLKAGSIWNDLIMMENIMPHLFGGLPADVLADSNPWKEAFFGDVPPHEAKLPGEWESKLTNFQKLLVLVAFRPEKLVFGVRVYVVRELGQLFAESPAFDLEAAFSDSTNMTPLIFILSPGADINDYLLELAKNKGKDTLASRGIISLGQGQGIIAEKLMASARQSGEWVCLQNCHLAVSWLPRLEMLLEAAENNPNDTHAEFRIWLTSMPSPKFPVPVLQNGIKITNEPPKGLKANLMRTFTDMKTNEWEGGSRPKQLQKLIFAVALFNANILERKKFGAVGWNIPYGFMNSDLKAAIEQVRMYVEEAPGDDRMPWTTLNFIVAQIVYGGRVTDKMDKFTISSILTSFFDSKLIDNDDYMFSEGGEYTAPVCPLTKVEAMDFIGTWPVEDPPSAFGLHENANITFQQKDTKRMLDTVIAMSGGGGGGGGGGDADAEVAAIAQAIEKRMIDQFDSRRGHPQTFKKTNGKMCSTGVFLQQELDRFNGLIAVMKSTLHDLQRAIKGFIVMSGPLENMYNDFIFQRVPGQWENAGYPCLKPLPSWTEDHFSRLTFMGSWLKDGPPSSFWLPAFFFPQGFMTAVKQTFSRDYKIAIDILVVGCEIMPIGPSEVKKPPKDGVYVYGMFMEGARFDREKMEITESRIGDLFDPMPCIWLLPVKSEDYKPQSTYSCPLYKTSIRAGTLSTTGHSTNFVVALDVKTSMPLNADTGVCDHWVKRGAAMLCMLDT